MEPFTVAPSQLDELMHRLTPRQMQIVELLAQGYGYKDICAILSISRTVAKHHVTRAYRKVEVENKMQLIVLYVVWRVTKAN